MEKLKKLKIVLRTEKEIAQYYFNREFSSINLELVKNDEGYYDIINPSNHVIIQDYLDDYANEEELRDKFEEENINEGESYPDEEFFEWIEENNIDFNNYKNGDWIDKHYPMWGYVFGCSDFYIKSEYMDVDKLYKLGIGVIEHDTGYYLFISGAGYDFYDAHWIPLFKKLGWIQYKKNGSRKSNF